MSASEALFETAIIISPVERLQKGEYDQLPLHINVVDPFIASQEQVNKLATRLAPTFLRNVFDITGLEHKDRRHEQLQRLGGSVLHHLHDEIIDTLDSLKIDHDNVAWAEGTTETWYSGTWLVPNKTTRIGRIHLAQEVAGNQKWNVRPSYELKVPTADFRRDPLYIDSLLNPVGRRKAS